jgi:hypothetical protein
VVRAAAVALAIALWGPISSALAVGYPDHSYGTVANSLTASKPESKLWFNDGWWATMADPASGAQHIFRLDRATERWLDTGTTIDPRAAAHADVLWDAANGKLYVASHAFTENGNTVGGGGKLYRFSYDPATRTYSRDAGFPVMVSPLPTETLVIARDSTGTVWATWTLNSKVWVSHTTGGNDASWIAPYEVPLPGADVGPDDISSIVAFAGNQIGVMWSNHVDGRFYFATHADGAGDTAFDWTGGAIPGTPPTDDHINLKADSAGRVYAAVKFTTTAPTQPLLALLVRDPTLGTWEQHTLGTVLDSQTRPIVLLDEQRQLIHVFYTGPEPPSPTGQDGGTIYEKTSPMSPINFPPGDGTPEIRDAASPSLNDATSTKQAVTTQSGMVVLANNPTTNVYWHTDIRLDGSSPPPAPPPPAPPAPPAGALSFTATADAFVRSTFADLNYGDWSSLRVRDGSDGSDTYRSYIRFTVTGLTGPVTSAVLDLKSATRNGNGGTVYAVGSPWDESSVTWATAPALGAVVGQVGSTAPGQIQVPSPATVRTRSPCPAARAGAPSTRAAKATRRPGCS